MLTDFERIEKQDMNGPKVLWMELLKGTGTRDLIWLKVVSLYRSWLVGLTDDL